MLFIQLIFIVLLTIYRQYVQLVWRIWTVFIKIFLLWFILNKNKHNIQLLWPKNCHAEVARVSCPLALINSLSLCKHIFQWILYTFGFNIKEKTIYIPTDYNHNSSSQILLYKMKFLFAIIALSAILFNHHMDASPIVEPLPIAYTGPVVTVSR